VLVAAVSLESAIRSGQLPLVFWLPQVFVTIHVGSGVGILRELLWGKWTRQPKAERLQSRATEEACT
jgi:hypothetical protein